MLSVKPDHLRRYRDIAWLLWKHGRADWVRSSGLDAHISDEFKDDSSGPESLLHDLEWLGPTFIKIGQFLASRADLLHSEYLSSLSRLQDDVEPVPFEKIEEVLSAELNARPSRVFAEIDSSPIAAASLAQVHAATLRDGREVAVKVQRPGIVEEIRGDFETFLSIARLGAYTANGRKYCIEDIVSGFQKVADQITAGLILGSLIIGAALLMRIETSVKLFGYPVLAIVLFLAAALGGVMLLYQIVVEDNRKPK